MKPMIDAKLRVRILQRNGYTCQYCGRSTGDKDPLDLRKKIRLDIDHIDPDGPASEMNLRVLCSACNQGRSNIHLPRSTISLLAAIRKANREDQLKALDWLKNKFESS
jgi:5-methylcytosine-specific restriction endonuclease McrA